MLDQCHNKIKYHPQILLVLYADSVREEDRKELFSFLVDCSMIVCICFKVKINEVELYESVCCVIHLL